MGGHGGLNILPQKSWHVYNQDNREKVARDEAKFEAEEKERREKHRKAESEYRHAALLARVRGEPLGAARPSVSSPPPALEQQQQQQQQQPLPVRHDIMASKRAVQQEDGHFNFWRQEELRAGNAEVKADEVQERRKRGKAETQTSDARFDERFKLGHAMHGKAYTPWYAATGVSTLPADELRALDGGQLLAAASAWDGRGSGAAALLEGSHRSKHKHKDKDRKDKKRHKEKRGSSDASRKVGARQLKASVAAMRAEREAREAAERARERQLLRRDFRGA